MKGRKDGWMDEWMIVRLVERDALYLLAVAETEGGPVGDSLFLFFSALLIAPAPAVPFSVPLAIVPHTLVLEAGSCK